jgi:hypothetical protein
MQRIGNPPLPVRSLPTSLVERGKGWRELHFRGPNTMLRVSVETSGVWRGTVMHRLDDNWRKTESKRSMSRLVLRRMPLAD